MPSFRIDRRQLAAGLAATAAGCGTLDRRVLVNVAAPQADQADQADQATRFDGAGRVTAAVMINGQGPFDFVVDTGANRTVIASDLAERLALPSGGVANIHGVAGVEPAPTARVAEVAVDAVISRNLRSPLLPRARLGADGLLGVDVLRDRRVVMDFQRRRLFISPASRADLGRSGYAMRRDNTGGDPLRPQGEAVAVPARYRFGQLIVVDADASGRRITVFLDSGAQSTVGNGPLKNAVIGSTVGPAPIRYGVPVLSATGQVAQGELLVMPSLRIGGLSIARLTTVFSDLHVFKLWDLADQPSLLLGMDVMRQFNAVELNYARREVIFYLR